MQKYIQCEHPLNIHLKQALQWETLSNAVVFGLEQTFFFLISVNGITAHVLCS